MRVMGVMRVTRVMRVMRVMRVLRVIKVIGIITSNLSQSVRNKSALKLLSFMPSVITGFQFLLAAFSAFFLAKKASLALSLFLTAAAWFFSAALAAAFAFFFLAKKAALSSTVS